jgi:hypothetical protein
MAILPVSSLLDRTTYPSQNREENQSHKISHKFIQIDFKGIDRLATII